MLPEFETLTRSAQPDESKMGMLFDDLGRATVRARLGQQALAQLYLGLGAFLATSIALSVVTFARLHPRTLVGAHRRALGEGEEVHRAAQPFVTPQASGGLAQRGLRP